MFCSNELYFVDGINKMPKNYGGDLPLAVFEIVHSFPVDDLVIAYDNHTGKTHVFAFEMVHGDKNNSVYFRL